MEMILYTIVGALVGGIIAFIITNNQKKTLSDRINSLMSEKQALATEASVQKARADNLQQMLSDAKTEAKRNMDEALAKQDEQFAKAIEALKFEMKDATSTMLKQRQDEFTETSSKQILEPLRLSLLDMQKVMTNNTTTQSEMKAKLEKAMQDMIRQGEMAQKSADELAQAFKHRSKVQGNWGERVLNELLHDQGLTEGVHFSTQENIKGDDDQNLRPDVILHLDQNREVIIDAKVSLTAYMDYVNASNEADRDKALKAHVDSVKQHVKELSKKDYSKYIKAPKVKMDYVIMFVPHSSALWTALNEEPDLWRRAMEQNVYIADEQTLYAALRIISLTWTQITQAQNHEKVYALANEMLNRVGQFYKQYEAIGKALDAAHKSYENGKEKITEGGQSIITTCNNLKKLGAKQSTTNPLPQIE